MQFLEKYQNQSLRLCARYKVKTLYAFGSVDTIRFNSDSDVDLVVDFTTTDPIEYAQNYFDLKFDLEKILERSIDLLENKAIKNPILRKSIDRSKVLLYGQ